MYCTWFHKSNPIFIALYLRYYTDACIEWRDPSPWLSARATQRNDASVASRWRRCADLTGPGIEPHR